MARIVYGVSGEGSGHSSRARVVLEHLTAAGHQVKVVTYGRGTQHLSTDFDVFETVGLKIVSVDNRVSPVKTLLANLQRLPDGHKRLHRVRAEVFKAFDPEVVITDFEPMCAYLANHYDLPLITIDNQHRLRYMQFHCPATLQRDRQLAVNVIRSLVPRPDVSLVTTFYYGQPKNDRTFLFAPLLRSEVRALKPSPNNHILVYLTSGFESFLPLLQQFPREHFIVYGQRDSGRDDNLQFKAPSKAGFLADLAECKAVMATAGFTLMTEALHLGKPYLALPMSGQFEQAINAIFLEQIKCGINMYHVTSAGIGDFLYRLPEFEQQLKQYKGDAGGSLLDYLDVLLADDQAVAKTFHQARGRRAA